MNPSNSDGKGPGTSTGPNGPKPEAGKPEAGKPEAIRPEAVKPEATKPGTTGPGSTTLGATPPGAVKPSMQSSASPSQPARTDAPKPAVPPVSTAPKPAEGKPLEGKPGDAKPDAAKAAAPLTEPVKSEPPKPTASTVDAGKAGGLKPEPSKTEPSKTEPAKAEPFKTEPPKAAGPGAAGANPSSMRTEPPKTGPSGSGAQSMPSKADLTDGPIIDLKAKRVPDPTEAAKAGSASSATKPSGSGTFTTNPDKASSPSDAKPTGSDTKPAGSDTKPAGSTTPKIGPAVAVAEPKRGGAGFGSVAAAGLLGGVIGAGLLFAVERSGALGVGDDGRIAALDQKIATLAPRDALAALDKRIGANEAVLKPLPEAIRSADAAAKDALQKAGAVSASPPAEGSAPAAALPQDLVARLDGLDQRVAALQEEPGRDQSGNAALTALSPQALSGLDDRLKAVEGKVESATKPAVDETLASQVTALKGDLEKRTKASSEADEALTQKLASLQQTLEARVKAATEAVQAATQASQQAVDANKTQAAEAAKGVERLFQAQSDKIAGLDKAVATRAEASSLQAAMRVVAADRIVGALNTGSPYADALAALRSSEPGDPARLSAVAAFADKGAPTARSLAAEFRPIAERIAASRKAAQAKSVAETGDIKQRLMSMAESIVQVRKVDAPAAPGEAVADDAVPKVQDALDRGAIAEAAKAFAGLPEDVRAQSGEFGTKLASRAAAGDAAQALLADAFKALPSTGTAR
ncbi:hypothetical protein FPV16_18480 [Methylobacterium sp. W2]|uniref:hypothetical protein n=1 Tax=Methylobacterium sp. W2 TaxID=2598107 RepID=UPI001D0C6C4B|nr:hypothetical protein [Methylobacterium sp. W2]MCC0808172.1 hypothetical protein [Methylobacterium sp. W2]